MQFRCPNCQNPIQILEQAANALDDETIDTVVCPSCNSRFSLSSDDASTATSPVGMTVDHFEIRELLGEGSFGTVFKAWDTKLFRNVALKVPRKGRITKETSKLFLREARAAAGISHPNVVGVYEVGQHNEGFYIATEFIDGVSLSEFLRNHSLAPNDAATLTCKILNGIQVFHDKGIIHRDLKPGNVLLDSQNEPHISDFGLARGENQADLTVTDSGRIVGTLLYMPPEQARGESRNLSARSDIYAIGVILFELLTGKRPFNSTSSRTLLYSILTDQPPAPRSVRRSIPRDLETICLKAMEKDPARRYPSASEMSEDLKRFLERKPIHARPVSALEKGWRLVCRHRVVSVLIALLLPLAFVIAVLLRSRDAGLTTELQHPTYFSYALAGNNVPANALADWTIMPLNKRTREPVEANAIRVHDAAEVRRDLAPGEYLVIAVVKGFGFHEVYRYVPEEPNVPGKPTYAHERWDVAADGTIELPRVLIRAEADVVQSMVQVAGGTFQMGDQNDASLQHSREVAGFYVDPTEVTAQEFSRFIEIGKDYPWSKDAPKVLAHWNAATAYAEFMGKRLLKEHEFEYLARDRGKSNYPGGDQSAIKPGQPWIYGTAGQPELDRLSTLPIYGIHSNVAEWTDSLLNRYPSMKDPGWDIERRWNDYRRRVVRGGPVKLGPNDRDENTWDRPVSYRSAYDMDTIDSEIGFRCARSTVPRFQEQK